MNTEVISSYQREHHKLCWTKTISTVWIHTSHASEEILISIFRAKFRCFHRRLQHARQQLGRINHLFSSDTTRTAQKMTLPTVPRCRGKVFAKPLPSNGWTINWHTHGLSSGTICPAILLLLFVYVLPLQAFYLAVAWQNAHTHKTDGRLLWSMPLRWPWSVAMLFFLFVKSAQVSDGVQSVFSV